jgi:hypothetical protein
MSTAEVHPSSDGHFRGRRSCSRLGTEAILLVFIRYGLPV